MYLLLAVIEWGGEHFYLYVFGFVIAVNLIMLHIFPNYIQPLFNKYTELEKGELRDKIESLASKLKFPLTKIFVVD
jgi:STE24 endopeptidase